VVFFFEAVEVFFLLDAVEVACDFDWSVVVATADSPRAWTSKQKVRKRAKGRLKELTSTQCSAIFQAGDELAPLTLKIHRWSGLGAPCQLAPTNTK
jgi:hypothetical protein